jgi:hypothetical protein
MDNETVFNKEEFEEQLKIKYNKINFVYFSQLLNYATDLYNGTYVDIGGGEYCPVTNIENKEKYIQYIIEMYDQLKDFESDIRQDNQIMEENRLGYYCSGYGYSDAGCRAGNIIENVKLLYYICDTYHKEIEFIREKKHPIHNLFYKIEKAWKNGLNRTLMTAIEQQMFLLTTQQDRKAFVDRVFHHFTKTHPDILWNEMEVEPRPIIGFELTDEENKYSEPIYDMYEKLEKFYVEMRDIAIHGFGIKIEDCEYSKDIESILKRWNVGIEGFTWDYHYFTPKIDITNNDPKEQPRHFARSFSETEQKKLFAGLKDGGFLPKTADFNHFCHVFGQTPIPDDETPFKPIQWIKTIGTTKGITPNKTSLLDFLTLLEIPEIEIKGKINQFFTVPKGKKFKSNNYNYSHGKLKTQSEYHDELAKIVSDSKEK